MRRINIPIPEADLERLRELARRELRDPREQAAWLVLDGLGRAGLDPERSSSERAAVAGTRRR